MTEQDLHRFDVSQLVAEGRRALKEQDYERAVALYREAVRRAPFRQDFKDGLAMAVEGSLGGQSGAQAATPAMSATLSAFTLEPADEARREPRRERVEEPGAEAAGTAGAGAGRRQPLLRPRGSGPQAVARKGFGKPSHFEARHRRGPLSALLLGILIGVFLIASVGGLAWFYVQQQQRPAVAPGGSSMSAARINNIIEQGRIYRDRGDYSLAVEQLKMLPEGPRRNRLLADLFMEQGDRAFHQNPPELESALDAYQRAVEYSPDNPACGNALGLTHYTLARVKSDNPEQVERSLSNARQSYEAVLSREANNLAALSGLAKVGVAQRDDLLAADCWKKIILAAPDSEEAQAARTNLRSRGFKF